jgi:16S rRNA (cytidine1402-2'-O)-methyltransferase
MAISTGILYLVATPIGNLKDITLRALDVLKEADLVACEDTRHSAKLLNHYGINKPLLSFYSYNQFNRIPKIIEELKSGKKIALVSDGGTPGISDPGYFLVKEAVENNIPVVPLPGPNAAITALVASGLPSDGFVFLGFLKRKPGKLKKELLQAAASGKTIIFYESPHRIKKTIAILSTIFDKNTKVVLARELTKIYEEFIRGSLEEINTQLESKEILGEFVVIISPENKEYKIEENENEES